MTGAKLLRRGAAKQKDAARRRWLLSHKDAYLNVPGLNEDVTDANRPALETLRQTMEDLRAAWQAQHSDCVNALREALASDPDGQASDDARRVLNLVTDNPAVMAVMGSEPACAMNGCQYLSAAWQQQVARVPAVENALSSPMAAGLLLTLKAECEAQHARAEKAERERDEARRFLRRPQAELDD